MMKERVEIGGLKGGFGNVGVELLDQRRWLSWSLAWIFHD
jgi:hypothetical protein